MKVRKHTDDKYAGLAKIDFAAAILVGGLSSRMGRNKAALEWNGVSLLRHIAGTLSPLFREVLVIGTTDRHTLPEDVRSVPDILPGRGPLGGIHSALMHASSDAVFVTACDTPRITTSAVGAFLGLWDGATAFAAREGERIHPLFALYTKRALPAIEDALRDGKHRIQPLLHELDASYVELVEFNVDHVVDMLANVNTPDDYQRLLDHDCDGAV